MNRRRMMMLQKNSSNVLYLYNLGDECIDVTGGWRNFGFLVRSDAGTAQKNETEMFISVPNQGGDYATTMSTVNPIDLSEYKYICVDCDYGTTNTDGMSVLGLVETIRSAETMNQAFEGKWANVLGVSDEARLFSGIERREIPHEKLTKPTASYFSFVVNTWGATHWDGKGGFEEAIFTIRRVWLEK